MTSFLLHVTNFSLKWSWVVGTFKTKFQVFQVKNSEFPGVKLQTNCEVPGGFYAGSPEGQPLFYAL